MQGQVFQARQASCVGFQNVREFVPKEAISKSSSADPARHHGVHSRDTCQIGRQSVCNVFSECAPRIRCRPWWVHTYEMLQVCLDNVELTCDPSVRPRGTWQNKGGKHKGGKTQGRKNKGEKHKGKKTQGEKHKGRKNKGKNKGKKNKGKKPKGKNQGGNKGGNKGKNKGTMPTSPLESLLLFTPWNQLNFDVTGFNNTQASRDNGSCHFHAQLESSITLLSTDSVAPALSRASSCRLNDAFNVMSFLRGSDVSRLFLHTTIVCV